ncbi:hypothetical protein ADUPG1_008701, partial [Aduncisulcus paluster]
MENPYVRNLRKLAMCFCDPYQVYIPSSDLRQQLCLVSWDDYFITCDISKYEIADIYDCLDISNMQNLYDIEGLQYFISGAGIIAENTQISNIQPLSNLTQLYLLNIQLSSPYYSPHTLTNMSDLQNLSRFAQVYIGGGSLLNDISSLYRNVGMYELRTAALSSISNYFSTSYLSSPICRAESDAEFYSFLHDVFPAHYYSNSSDLNPLFLYNSCPIGSNSCAGVADCPYITRNEIYNNNVSPPQKQCSSIAKTYYLNDDLICYTVHDDNIRSYIIDTYPDIAESTGMISVASIRSTVSGSLNLSTDVITPYGNVSSLQGLEYATGLTELNLDGYDLSG